MTTTKTRHRNPSQNVRLAQNIYRHSVVRLFAQARCDQHMLYGFPYISVDDTSAFLCETHIPQPVCAITKHVTKAQRSTPNPPAVFADSLSLYYIGGYHYAGKPQIWPQSFAEIKLPKQLYFHNNHRAINKPPAPSCLATTTDEIHCRISEKYRYFNSQMKLIQKQRGKAQPSETQSSAKQYCMFSIPYEQHILDLCDSMERVYIVYAHAYGTHDARAVAVLYRVSSRNGVKRIIVEMATCGEIYRCTTHVNRLFGQPPGRVNFGIFFIPPFCILHCDLCVYAVSIYGVRESSRCLVQTAYL